MPPRGISRGTCRACATTSRRSRASADGARADSRGPRARPALALRRDARSASPALVASAYFIGSAARDRDLAVLPAVSPSGRARSGRRASLRTGSTIVYGAAWDGAPIQIYSTRPESPESAPLAIPPAERHGRFAVGRAGDLAGRRGPRARSRRSARSRASTLAGGGAARGPRSASQAADWAPDGGGARRGAHASRAAAALEFPIGHTLVRDAVRLPQPCARLAPTATWSRFIEHPIRGDDAGSVVVVDREGTQARALRRTGSRCAGSRGRPTAREVWFTARRDRRRARAPRGEPRGPAPARLTRSPAR